MSKFTIQEIQQRIAERLPEGKVIPRHNEKGHFYEVDEKKESNPVYPSVTGKLQLLKDESLINYKMNQAIQYIFRNFGKITEANLMEHLDLAANASQVILEDAGDIGTEIHDARERFFSEWIKTRIRPNSALDFIHEGNPDTRLHSAMNALEKFCDDYSYVPVATELLVYSHEYKIAGTLDDIGIMQWPIRMGNPHCNHEMIYVPKKEGYTCLKCNRKTQQQFVLLDLKTSNQFKDHYFFQVALYYWMLSALIGIKPERCFILKLSKENGTYKIEDLKRPAKLAQYARYMLKTHEGIAFIKSLRRDNQKIVGEKIEL